MEYKYYIIKVKNKNTIAYKIGEFSNTSRPEELIKKYESTFANTKAIKLAEGLLPCNSEKRLNDKTIHKIILKEKKFVKYDGYLLTSSDDGKDEFFRLHDNENMTDDEVVNYIADVVKRLGENEENFKGKVNRVKNQILNYAEQKHLVGNYYINKIDELQSLNEDIKLNILFIGQFDPYIIAGLALYNDVTIWYDSKDQKITYIDKIEQNLTYVEDLEGLLKMCKKFDYIIANLPYSIGNELTKTIIENVEFKKYINLMPTSKYKSKELYRYVKDIERVEDTFEDADVGDSLTLAQLDKTPCGFSSYDELEMCKYEPKLLKFYKGNSKRENNINYSYIYKISQNKEEVRDALNKANSNTYFFVYRRTSKDGIHTNDDAIDRKWNLGQNVSNTIFDITKWTGGAWGTQGGFIQFNAKNEKDNFTEFWYRDGKDGLMNKLIKGLNKSCGTIELAIPRVDWTRKWTAEEILKEYGYTDEEIKEII